MRSLSETSLTATLDKHLVQLPAFGAARIGKRC